MKIPVLDLDLFSNGTVQARNLFIKEIGRAFEDIGFVAIDNPGISEKLIDELYETVQQFFALPLEKKKRYEIAGISGQRGYTSFGKEHAKGSLSPDLKEFFQYGQLDITCPELLKNVEVPEIPGFNRVFSESFAAFEKSGIQILSAIAEYLGLNQHYFNDKVLNGNSILRAIHYPPIINEPLSAIRAEQHEDINLITLLVGASADGLEILTKDGTWNPVFSNRGQIIVNVGDMLQRLTNNKLKSTTHRVVNPPRSLWHTSRFSVPFFLHPQGQTSLACLDNCINDDLPKIYEDITADEYLDQRLREIGLKG
jgi:isopenicillin N synthase-like dioxygenase